MFKIGDLFEIIITKEEINKLYVLKRSKTIYDLKLNITGNKRTKLNPGDIVLLFEIINQNNRWLQYKIFSLRHNKICWFVLYIEGFKYDTIQDACLEPLK